MKRRLELANLAGVLLLAVLCVVQWKTHRRLNLRIADLEKSRLELTARSAEQTRALEGCSADLEEFRGQLMKANLNLKEARLESASSERELHTLRGQGEQLKAGITNWSNAVTARDQQLVEASRQIRELATDRNETVIKFNELADRYQSLVRQWNAMTTNSPGLRAD